MSDVKEEAVIVVSEEEWKRVNRQLAMYADYAGTYGNAVGVCKGGYPQQTGLICGHCQADSSAGDKCGMKEGDFE